MRAGRRGLLSASGLHGILVRLPGHVHLLTFLGAFVHRGFIFEFIVTHLSAVSSDSPLCGGFKVLSIPVLYLSSVVTYPVTLQKCLKWEPSSNYKRDKFVSLKTHEDVHNLMMKLSLP